MNALIRLLCCAAAVSCALTAWSCRSDPTALPGRGEALVVVDTDLPAPAIAGHLRVDFYSADGVWYESRGLAVPDASRWPLSFSVYSEDFSHDTQVVVRLRVYPDGRERDYSGERYTQSPIGQRRGGGVDGSMDAGAPDAAQQPPHDKQPKLDHGDDGGDVSPTTEPLPAIAAFPSIATWRRTTRHLSAS